MGNYKPLLIPIFVFLAVGILLQLLIVPLGLGENEESFLITTGLVSAVISLLSQMVTGGIFILIPTDWSLFGINFTIPILNFFFFLPEDVAFEISLFITEQMVAWTHIPDLILIPAIIIGFVSMLYGVIKTIFP